ncbi:hypothetical protein Dimus_028546 [Dionaea muscipula]
MGVIRALQLKANELIVNPNSSSSSFFISRISVRQLHSSITQATADARLHSGEGDDEDEDQPTSKRRITQADEDQPTSKRRITQATADARLHSGEGDDEDKDHPTRLHSGEGDDEDKDHPTSYSLLSIFLLSLCDLVFVKLLAAAIFIVKSSLIFVFVKLLLLLMQNLYWFEAICAATISAVVDAEASHLEATICYYLCVLLLFVFVLMLKLSVLLLLMLCIAMYCCSCCELVLMLCIAILYCYVAVRVAM